LTWGREPVPLEILAPPVETAPVVRTGSPFRCGTVCRTTRHGSFRRWSREKSQREKLNRVSGKRLQVGRAWQTFPFFLTSCILIQCLSEILSKSREQLRRAAALADARATDVGLGLSIARL